MNFLFCAEARIRTYADYNLSGSEKMLYVASLMLYWAEGAKAQHGIVDFANCNTRIVYLFLSVLRQIYQVKEDRIRVLLYCYANQNSDKIIDFWSKLTKISRSQFTKPYVRKDFREEKEGKMKYGMVHIRYSDKKLLSQIMSWIQRFQKRYCVGTQVVNEDWL